MENDKNTTNDELETKDTVQTENSNGQQSNDEDESKSTTKNNGTASKTFSQEQVTAMMAKEKKQGKASVYKELGIDPNDSNMVSMFKAFIESQKTEEQKQQEQSATNAATNAAKYAEIESRAKIAEAKVDAMQLGVLPQYVDDVVTLVLARQSEDVDIKTEVSQLKSKYPFWFGGQPSGEATKTSTDSSTGQKGTGSSVKTSSKAASSGEEKGLGSRLAAQRRGNTSNSSKSYWS